MNRDEQIVIVGGGAAGIGAARRLAAAGQSTVLLEARDRLGGRAWTSNQGGAPLDLGCGWLHSAERNPWRAIAEAGGHVVDRTPAAWRRQYRELGFSRAEQAEAAQAFDAWDRRLRDDPPASDRASDALEPGNRWNGWIDAISGYVNGAPLSEVSVADYCAYDDAASEHNWRLPGGYGTLVASAVPAGCTVRLGTRVSAIDLREKAVRVVTDGGELRAAAAIVTVPTAVLAAGAITLPPALDPWLHAAAALPLGLANKLFLALDAPEWMPPDQHLLGRSDRAETGSYTLRPFGRPMVECFFGGSGAAALEAAGAEATVAFAVDELVALLGARWRAALRPVAQSAWGSDPFARGSYSHARPGEARARAVLASQPDERLLFAGEACSPQDFSTAHGALGSGIAAAEIMLARSSLA